MMCVYETDIDKEAVVENLIRIRNQIYKLLPMNEEGEEWIKPLETLIIELLGLAYLFQDQKGLLTLVSKLEGIRQTGEEIDFMLFRRTIFDACGLVGQVIECL